MNQGETQFFLPARQLVQLTSTWKQMMSNIKSDTSDQKKGKVSVLRKQINQSKQTNTRLP